MPRPSPAQALPKRARRGRRAAFTLMEVVVAMLIFFVMITFSHWAMSDALDQSSASERERQLVMLAQRKLGEIAVFEHHHDENLGPEKFDDLPEGMREAFEGWEWQLDVTDFTTFGTAKDNAPPLFDSSETATDPAATTDTTQSASASAKKDSAQVIRQLTLKVWAPGDDGGEGDSIEIVTYLPQVAAKTADKKTPAAGDPPK